MDLERIRGIAERVAVSEGLELVAVEWAGSPAQGILRIILDRPEGAISHRDCGVVSEQVGAILDVEDLIPGRYVLEVASPGLDRKLYRPADYERFRGRRVKVRLKHRRPELPGRRFQAELAGLAEGVVSFVVDGQTVRIPYDDIAAVNLVIEF
ncbi:MAG: ribosome maturation factor RimP [Acidobacteria bacterium]|nr:ribosome maturation factor RimP [Acidobacteriota bacterium]